jgi:outer membrane receptor for ferrienterochelin and colicins
MKKYFITTGFLIATLITLAQPVPKIRKDSAFNKEQDLTDVVITATRSERKLGNVAVPVQIVSQKQIHQTGSLRSQDILQEQTGIVIVNSNLGTSLNGYPNPFGQGVQMLGLDPAYTLILLDGEPLVGRNAGILKLGRLATGNIKQVEIVKGPSSSLYGSEAMAGVINIITASPQKEKVELQLHSAVNNTWGGTVSYANRFNKTGIQFFVNRYSSSGYDLDPDLYGKTVDPIRDWNGQLKITHDFSNKLQWLISLRDFDSKQSNNYQIYWQNNPSVVKGYTTEKDQTAFTQLRWQWKPEHKIYFRTFYDRYRNHSYVNLDKTTTQFDETTFNQSIVKPEIQFESSKGNKSRYVAGLGSYFEMIDASRYAGKKTLTTLYAFTQEEWSLLHEKLTVIAGGRIDKRNDFTARLSPRVGLAYKPNEKWKFTASSGWGFKAPDFRHLYLNFFNSQIGYSLLGSQELGSELLRMQQQGLLQPGADVTPYLNTPDLKPETSFGSHAGVRYTDAKWTIEGGLFRNDIRNLIDVFTLPFSKSNSQAIFSYHNIGRVYTQGLEIDIKYKLSPVFFVSGGYQFLDAKDKDVIQQIKKGSLYKRDPVTFQTTVVTASDYFGLFNRSRHTANFKILYDNEKTGWNAYIRFVYRGKYGYGDINGDNIADDSGEMVNGFLMANVAVAKSINDHFQLQAGVENIFDYTNAQKLPNIPGRLFFININYSFGKFFLNNKQNKQ